MLATIKISPTFKDYFNELEYQVDINSYYDIEFYLRSVHPKFGNYIKQINSGISQEGFAYLDKNLKVVDPQSFPLKKIKEKETIYIAPIVCGGGGKKGFIFAAIILTAPWWGPALMGGLGIGAQAAVPAIHAWEGVAMQSTMSCLFAGIPSFVKGMLGNLALSAIGALLTSKPKAKQLEVTKDSGTRTENNMFGSLTNSTTSGTPIMISYGQMRIAGQFLSGYILSTEHGQDSAPSVQAIFTADATPLSQSTEEGT